MRVEEAGEVEEAGRMVRAARHGVPWGGLKVPLATTSVGKVVRSMDTSSHTLRQRGRAQGTTKAKL